MHILRQIQTHTHRTCPWSRETCCSLYTCVYPPRSNQKKKRTYIYKRVHTHINVHKQTHTHRTWPWSQETCCSSTTTACCTAARPSRVTVFMLSRGSARSCSFSLSCSCSPFYLFLSCSLVPALFFARSLVPLLLLFRSLLSSLCFSLVLPPSLRPSHPLLTTHPPLRFSLPHSLPSFRPRSVLACTHHSA